MTQAPGLPTREPVCDIPREAARPGPEPQPEMLPDKARFLSGAISFSIIPRLRVKEPCRRLMALETAVTRWAKHAVKPLAPTTVHRVEHAVARCLVLHDLACRRVHCARKLVASVCRGGFPASSLMDLAKPAGDERTRRISAAAPTTPPGSASTTWPPGVWAVSSIAAHPQAAIEPSPFAEIESAKPFPKVHALPNDGRQRAGLNLGKPVFPEPGFWIPIHWARPYRRQMPRAQDVSREDSRARVGVCGVCADLS